MFIQQKGRSGDELHNVKNTNLHTNSYQTKQPSHIHKQRDDRVKADCKLGRVGGGGLKSNGNKWLMRLIQSNISQCISVMKLMSPVFDSRKQTCGVTQQLSYPTRTGCMLVAAVATQVQQAVFYIVCICPTTHPHICYGAKLITTLLGCPTHHNGNLLTLREKQDLHYTLLSTAASTCAAGKGNSQKLLIEGIVRTKFAYGAGFH